MNRKIFKTGHSLAVTISTQFLRELGLKVGDAVKVELDKELGGIVIRQGKSSKQLALNLSVRPKLGAK